MFTFLPVVAVYKEKIWFSLLISSVHIVTLFIVVRQLYQTRTPHSSRVLK